MGCEASERQTLMCLGVGHSHIPRITSLQHALGVEGDLDSSLLLPLLSWVTSGQPCSFSKCPSPDGKNYGKEMISWGTSVQ